MSVCRGVTGLLLVLALSGPGVVAEDGQASNCTVGLAAAGYCMTIEMRDVTYGCVVGETDYVCTMSGELSLAASGPADLPGYARLWGYVDMSACPGSGKFCDTRTQALRLDCSWETAGSCDATTPFLVTLTSPVFVEECEFAFGYLSIDGEARMREDVDVSVVGTNELEATGWYEEEC